MSRHHYSRADSRKNTTLVMFSGGIDSTAALWHVLHNIDIYGKVHAHHVHMQNIEGRWQVEARAVRAVYEYLRSHVDVDFATSESAIDVPSFKGGFLYDTEVTGFIGGYITSREPSISKMVFGVTSTDLERGSTSAAIARGKAAHNAFHLDDDDHSAAIKEYPLKHLSKQEVYDTLPADLARLTWSCRRPRSVAGSFIECGVCKTCRLELRNLKRVKR